MADQGGEAWQVDSEKVLSRFERDGYVALRSFLNHDEVAEIQAMAMDFIRESVPALPREQIFYEELGKPDALKQIQQLFTERAQVDEEAHAAYQKRLAEEMKAKGKI